MSACASVAIYSKCLRVSLNSNKAYRSGELISIMQNDVEKLQTVAQGVSQSIFLPLQLIFCLLIMYEVMGIVFLPGFAVTVLITIVNMWIGNIY